MRILLSLLCLAFICISGCGRTLYHGLPDLPEKDWLQDDKDKSSPGPEQAPEIYSPRKTFTLDDLVWLAIQQSPAISKGKINLEIQEIAKRDAKWRYLPEMHLNYTISNNITRYNESDPGYGNDTYGETAYQLSFSGVFNNPVATYFSTQAQEELMNVAIVTQRKAITDAIMAIASSLLRIDLREKILELMKKRLAEIHEQENFSEVHSRHSSNINLPTSIYSDMAADLELRIREMQMGLIVEKSNLKQLVGLNLDQALKVDAASVYKLLQTFNPAELKWKSCWDNTEDNYLLRQQVRLEDANIWLAWAQYMPNISIAVNENAPNGQSQPADARTDQFLHLTFDLPILDWGHRWRMAEMSAARKRQRRLDALERERQYGQRWMAMGQELALASARVERWQHTVRTSARRAEAIEIAYRNGSADRAQLGDYRTRSLDADISLLEARERLAQTKLTWMHFAARLGNHYLGEAGFIRETKK